MFAVMGITGNVGGALANTLHKQGKKVRGIVRDASKAQAWKDKGVEIVTANYDDHLIAAFTDVEGVFCMIPPDVVPAPGFPDSVTRIAAIKKAVLIARPPRAVFLSSIGGEKTSGLGIVTTAHLLEEELGSTEVPSAFLRAGSFMENILHSIPIARTTGMYFSFYQPIEHPIPLVATEDIGRVGAETLLQTWQGNRFIEISGPAYYSPNDVAAALEKALDRPVTCVAVPRETWIDTLAQHGMPADRSGAYIEMTDSFNSRWIDFGAPGAEHVKGTIDLVTTVKSLAGRAS
jgi:NAD(P)H dehydrogenase (quinone)